MRVFRGQVFQYFDSLQHAPLQDVVYCIVVTRISARIVLVLLHFFQNLTEAQGHVAQ